MRNKFACPMQPILVIDDEPSVLESFEIELHSSGFTNVITCVDSRMVMDILRKNKVSLILLDLIMPYISGEELIIEITKEFPGICIIVVTAVGDINKVVESIHNGAIDYLLKPVEKGDLKNRVFRCIEMNELKLVNEELRDRLLNGHIKNKDAFKQIITQDSKMIAIFQYCEAVAISSYPVMITGETGAGKELIANAIHKISGRPGKLVATNVSSFDDTLFADTLFGHVKGAFTGADVKRLGLVEKAKGGTLFLDEIGDLNTESQTKLLRLLQEREYSPIGSDTKKNANIRVIASTNKDLKKLRKNGKFRDDLYYRLFSHHIELPPLRERYGDIRMLLEYFIEEASFDMEKPKPTYHPELINLLKTYNFPGNIRELKHMVADAVGNHKTKMLSSKIFKEYIEKESGPIFKNQKEQLNLYDFDSLIDTENGLPKLKEATNNLTKALINKALDKSGGNQTIAASLLGISQQSLSHKIKNLL